MTNSLPLLNSYIDNYLDGIRERYTILEMELPSENKLREKALTTFLIKMYKTKLISIISVNKEKYKDVLTNMALYYANNKLYYAHLARVMVIESELYGSIINLLDIAINKNTSFSNCKAIILTLATIGFEKIIDNKTIIDRLEESLSYVGKLPKE